MMSDLPKGFASELDEEWAVFTTAVARHHVAPDGTDKLLLDCQDGRRIECVLMAEDDRRTVCISTQVGCGMGCVFCASGLKGVERNLTRGEIVEQVLRLRNLLPAGERLTNLVVMGMGESLANLDNLVAALDRICSPEGLGLGQRRVTISTVGLPEKMRKLAALDRQYHLAVSLHAPTEALRNAAGADQREGGLAGGDRGGRRLLPESGRQVTFEYVLLRGINDRPGDATALGDLLRGAKAHVNLIPYNPVAGLPFERPTDAAIRQFVATRPGPRGQRQRAEDQGARDRRGLRPAPTLGVGTTSSPSRRASPRVGSRSADCRPREDLVATGEVRPWSSSSRPATPTSG